jgi:hypothetical protein
MIAAGNSGNPNLTLLDNAFLNAAGNFEYQTSNPATKVEQFNGAFTFSNAASGTAGATASFSEKFRIDSVGQITQTGATNTSIGFTIKATATNDYVSVLQFNDNSGTRSSVMSDHYNNALIFKHNSNVERMRLDASGNFFVGKTAVNNDDNGLIVQPNGTSWFTATGDYPLGINRKSSDGSLITFTKDQAAVGTISSISGSASYNSNSGVIYLGHNQTNHFKFLTSQATGQPRFEPSGDNSIDIGRAALRFKNLYLGGGVHLGGTGSANKLDDYEEGTWTPTLANAYNINSLSLTEAGTYVKVGNLVHVDFDVTGSFTNAAVESRFSFTLPFNTATTSSRAVGIFAHLLTSFSNARFNNGQVFQGTTTNSEYWVYISTNQLSGTGNFNGRATLTYRAS